MEFTYASCASPSPMSLNSCKISLHFALQYLGGDQQLKADTCKAKRRRRWRSRSSGQSFKRTNAKFSPVSLFKPVSHSLSVSLTALCRPTQHSLSLLFLVFFSFHLVLLPSPSPFYSSSSSSFPSVLLLLFFLSSCSSAEEIDDLFPLSEATPPPSQPNSTTRPLSALSALLDEWEAKTNPFSDFAVHDGSASCPGEENSRGIAPRRVYLWDLPPAKRNYPVVVTPLRNTTIAQFIGLVAWKYTEEAREPALSR